MPVAERDLSVVAPARHADGPAVLLSAAYAVRKGVVGHHVIERRGRLREPRAPRLAAVQRDHRALVDDQQHDVRIVRVPPDVLVVVAARCALERHERLAAVGRLVADDVSDDQRVWILRVHVRHDFVDPADRPLIGGDARPGLAGVIGSEYSSAVVSRFQRDVDTSRTARRDGELGVDDASRQSLRERLPCRTAVSRLEDPAVGAVPGAVFPWSLPLLPHRGVDDVGVGGIDVDVLAAGVGVLEQDALECLAAVGGPEDAALFVGTVGMTERGDEEAIRIPRVDGNLRDLLRVAQSEVRPRRAGVRRFVDAVADRKVRPRQPFTTSDVQDVRIGWRHRDPAD